MSELDTEPVEDAATRLMEDPHLAVVADELRDLPARQLEAIANKQDGTQTAEAARAVLEMRYPLGRQP